MDLRSETDIEQLRRIALTQKVQIEQLLKVLAAKCKELESLKGDPKELQQTLELLEQLTQKARAPKDDESGQGSSDKPQKERKKREKFGNTAQPSLNPEPQLFELDEADQICTSCGGQLQPMAGQTEDSELIDVIQVSYRLVQVKQQKYRCRCGGCIETAPGPERAIPGSRYSLRFAVKVAVDKYLDHIPLARQVRILRRHGVNVTSQTLWGLLLSLEQQLRCVDDALLERVLAEPVIGLDQTSWKRLDDKKKKPWQIWCVTSPGVVVHRIRKDKGVDTFRELVGQYQGVIVCDAAKTHAAGARESTGIQLSGCWAHVYRKFKEAEPDHPQAHIALDYIKKLYDIDERASGNLDKRAKLRASESKAVIAELKIWLWSQATLKSLSIGKAAAYAIGTWDRLTRFLDDARIPLDNNATERAIRGPVVGRRNHFGSKSEQGTRVAATFYTLLETAKLHGIDPTEYLLEAVRAAARNETLLPWNLSN